MKKSFLIAAIAGLASLTLSLRATDLDTAKAKVVEVAKHVGADLSILDQAQPLLSPRRSDAGKAIVDPVDNVLRLSTDAVQTVTQRIGIYCSMDACPHAGSLSDAKATLAELSVSLGKGKEGGAVLIQAAKLHHAAASILAASKAQLIQSEPIAKVRRSQVVKMKDEIKLDLAEQLAELAGKLADQSGR